MPGDWSNAVPFGRRLTTGAEMRVTGPTDRAAVVCVNGGQGRQRCRSDFIRLEGRVERVHGRADWLTFSAEARESECLQKGCFSRIGGMILAYLNRKEPFSG